MLLGANSSLENSVISSLTMVGGLSATQILQAVQSSGNKASVQGIYKILSKLQGEGILNKQGTTYSLRLPWILDLVELVEQMQEVYFNKNYFLQIIPTSYAEKKRWHFNSLIKLVDFWIDIQLALISHTKATILYSYAPHAWQGLTHAHQLDHFKKILKKRKGFHFSVVGSKTYLDQYLNSITKDSSCLETYLYDQNEEFENNRKIYTTVIGDYIVSIKLGTEAMQRIDDMFSQITGEDDMYLLTVLDTFTKKVRSSIQIKKDPVAAKKFKNKFVKVFGPAKLYIQDK